MNEPFLGEMAQPGGYVADEMYADVSRRPNASMYRFVYNALKRTTCNKFHFKQDVIIPKGVGTVDFREIVVFKLRKQVWFPKCGPSIRRRNRINLQKYVTIYETVLSAKN